MSNGARSCRDVWMCTGCLHSAIGLITPVLRQVLNTRRQIEYVISTPSGAISFMTTCLGCRWQRDPILGGSWECSQWTCSWRWAWRQTWWGISDGTTNSNSKWYAFSISKLINFEYSNPINGCCMRRKVCDAVDGGRGILVSLVSIYTVVVPAGSDNSSFED